MRKPIGLVCLLGLGLMLSLWSPVGLRQANQCLHWLLVGGGRRWDLLVRECALLVRRSSDAPWSASASEPRRTTRATGSSTITPS